MMKMGFEIMKTLLKLKGYDVSTLASGSEAIEFSRQISPA
jgi:hypothetical protein